jgi:hypothetical protein
MPKGQYERKPKPPIAGHTEALWAELSLAIERIADLERRLVQANEYFAKGYIPPNV